MAFNPVPLAIGNGAVHSDDVQRIANNILSGNSQGVNLPGDFKVTATGPASGSVTIAPGGMVLRNAQLAGQSYVADAPTPTAWSSGLTQAGSHLIIARIIDPDFAPWQPSGTPGAPNTSVANGPYFQPFTVPGVGNTVTRASQVVTYTAEALARIDNPSGSGTITPDMIKDLRRLATKRTDFAYDRQSGPATPDFVTTSETNWHDWPSNSFQVDVPDWATHLQAMVDLHISVEGPANVDLRVNFGGLTGPTSFFDYNGTPAAGGMGAETVPITVYGEFDVRTFQGQRVTLKTQARRTFASEATGNAVMGPAEQLTYDCRFSERVV